MDAVHRAAEAAHAEHFRNVALGPLALAANSYWIHCTEVRGAYAERAFAALRAALSNLIEDHACAGWPEPNQARALALVAALHAELYPLPQEACPQ